MSVILEKAALFGGQFCFDEKEMLGGISKKILSFS